MRKACTLLLYGTLIIRIPDSGGFGIGTECSRPWKLETITGTKCVDDDDDLGMDSCRVHVDDH